MEYSLQTHGDPLEQKYSEFVQKHFRTYELVWKLYIGNKGNDTRADIENYPKEREEKRQKFSEHTYTILQSLISLHRLIDREVFEKGFISSIEELLDLQDNLILFFSCLGRIRDNIQEASRCLLNIDENETTALLDEFYHKRHLVVHGKMIPIILNSNGEISLPILSKSTVDVTGWYHKINSWQDVSQFSTETIGNTTQKLYWDLLPILEQIFGIFRKSIESELTEGNFVLKYDTIDYKEEIRYGSGSYASGTVSVYGIQNYGPAYKK